MALNRKLMHSILHKILTCRFISAHTHFYSVHIAIELCLQLVKVIPSIVAYTSSFTMRSCGRAKALQSLLHWRESWVLHSTKNKYGEQYPLESSPMIHEELCLLEYRQQNELYSWDLTHLTTCRVIWLIKVVIPKIAKKSGSANEHARMWHSCGSCNFKNAIIL